MCKVRKNLKILIRTKGTQQIIQEIEDGDGAYHANHSQKII